MPISPQQVAPPLDQLKLQAVYQDIDRQLQNAQCVSSAIEVEGSELFKSDLTTLTVTVLGHKLNLSEQEKLAKDYTNAGWKEARVLRDGVEPGRGAFTVVLLRAIQQAMPK